MYTFSGTDWSLFIDLRVSVDDYRGCKPGSETIVTRSKAVTGNDLRHSDYVAPSQYPVELTLDNEPLFKYQLCF